MTAAGCDGQEDVMTGSTVVQVEMEEAVSTQQEQKHSTPVYVPFRFLCNLLFKAVVYTVARQLILQ